MEYAWEKPPVVIWCDDFGGAGSLDKPYEDCGWSMFQTDNGIRRLHEILEKHPHTVVTLFTVPYWSNENLLHGKKVTWDNVQRIDDNDRGFNDWLQELDKNPFYDIQLHGFQHKYEVWKPFFSRRRRAKQEFEYFKSFDEAYSASKKGYDIFTAAFNRPPSGNRFPGWNAGEFGFEAMRRVGIKWFADYDSESKICWIQGLLNFPMGYKLSKIEFEDIDDQLSKGKVLFITTHVEGATPTRKIRRNSVYHLHEKLDKVLQYIEDNHKVWWTGGDALAEYIYSVKINDVT